MKLYYLTSSDSVVRAHLCETTVGGVKKKVVWWFYINKVAAIVPAEEDFNSAECI